MIADNSTAMKVRGNLGGSKHQMAIDLAAMSHIMGILTDLYSDPAKAIIREYTTNAWDAHVEVGNSQPIEVTLPNPMSPFFKVRDYGVGLTEDDIAQIYSQYGASTKRSTNDQVGMLGLGSKSALTYVQQFTIVSVKDGERIQVAVSREAEGGSMTVVDRRDTDDADGTEVVVPAKKDPTGGYASFISRAHEFFSYWPEDTVLVNGEKPERVDGHWLSKTLLVREMPSDRRYQAAQHKVVMGHVPYPVEAEYVPGFKVAQGYEVVAFVGIGDVKMTPNRESLEYNDLTKATCKQLSEDFVTAARNYIQREVNKAKTPHTAIASAIAARAALASAGTYGRYTYKGKQLPESFTLPNAGYSAPIESRILLVPRKSYVQSQSSSVTEVPLAHFPHSVWMHGYNGKKFSAPQKKKIKKYLTDHGYDESAYTQIVLTASYPTEVADWIDPKCIVKWEDVQAIKLPRDTSALGGYTTKDIPGSYENCVVDGAKARELEAKNIDQQAPIYWYTGSWYYVSEYMKIVGKFEKHYTIVPLAANRKDKFLRLFPKAIKLEDAVKEFHAKWEKSLTTEDWKALALDQLGMADTYSMIDPAKVDDPDIKALAKLARKSVQGAIETRNMFSRVIGTASPKVKVDDPLKKYPLFSSYNLGGGTKQDHTYLYLNAAYAA